MLRIAIQSKGRLNEESLALLRDDDIPHVVSTGSTLIAKKVGEETVEALIEAVDGNRERFIYETSDLVYHMLVLMETMGCTVDDIERELALRHR